MKKLLGVTAVTLLLALTGCGGADDVSGDDYCAELKDAKESFSNFEPSQLDEARYNEIVDEFDRLADVAPDDVKAEWEAARDGIMRLHDLLGQAGIDLDAFQDIQSGQIPPNADAQKLQELVPELQEAAQDLSGLSSTKIQESAKECGVTLD